jgi:hypothetical protein
MTYLSILNKISLRIYDIKVIRLFSENYLAKSWQKWATDLFKQKNLPKNVQKWAVAILDKKLANGRI